MGAYMDHAMRLSPHDPMVPLWLSMRGGVELLLGHDQVAVDMLRQSAVSLRLARNYRLLAAALELTGDQEGARSAVAAFRSLAGRGVQRPAEEAYIQNPAYLQQRARVSAALQRLGL
jgi:predicted Zn-dependent protease